MKSTEPNSRENTPKHCWNCWKFSECKQAQNMTADTEPVKGLVDTKAVDYTCFDCLSKSEQDNLQEFEYLSELPWDESMDCPAHCCKCGIPLSHCLTTEGAEYVKEELKDGGGCCRELWPVIWADYL